MTALNLAAVLLAGALAGCSSETSAGFGSGDAHPCSAGAPVREERAGPGFIGEPPPDAIEWQHSVEDVAEQVRPLAGDRLGGIWLRWEPERQLVIDLTEGPEVSAVHDAVAASGLDVDVRYTATASLGELIEAMRRIGGDLAGVGGMGVDERNNRVRIEVASGDDGGAATCARLNEILANTDVPYAFEVFEAGVEQTVRTTVGFNEAHDFGGTTLQLIVGSCNGDPEVTALEETADEVRIEVTSTIPAPGWGGDGCLDSFDVVLDAPLGDRRLVDLTTGRSPTVYDRS